MGSATVRRVFAVVAITLTLGGAGQASAAVDLTSLYSVEIARDVFARHYDKVWSFIAPAYTGEVKRSRWQRCIARFAADSAVDRIQSVRVVLTRRFPSKLPLLGSVVLIDDTIQVLYTLPGSRGLEAAALFAYWVKEKGKWRGVWLPTQLSAYKAGTCAPGSLY